nr:N-6 DNA methylase [Rhodococcus sp. 06-621-2]
MEKDSLNVIVQALREVGFPFIQVEPVLRGNSSRFRPDVVGWASDRNGELVPWCVVEVKNTRAPLPPGLALDGLAKARELLGTVDHYAVINGQWFKATSGLLGMDLVEAPTPPRFGGEGQIVDETLAVSILREQLWRRGDEVHGRGGAVRVPTESLITSDGIESPFGGRLPVRADVLFTASRKALIEIGSRGKEMGLFTSHPGVARAVAALAGPRLTGSVLDPFCGTGSFLWAAIDEGLRGGRTVTSAFGIDLSIEMVQLAKGISSVSPTPTVIECGSAFDLPTRLSDVVVSAPPLGVRLAGTHLLMNGESTKDMDIAAIDLAIRSLKEGGRAVVQTSPGFAFKRQGEPFRSFLSSTFRVGALIGLPRGSVAGAGVGSLLVVIDRSPPVHNTFVAQLGEDWETQLAAGGAALSSASTHLESLGS